jgi:hypothetical protein
VIIGTHARCDRTKFDRGAQGAGSWFRVIADRDRECRVGGRCGGRGHDESAGNRKFIVHRDAHGGYGHRHRGLPEGDDP